MAALLLVALLALFGLAISRSSAERRQDADQRFGRRAQVAAALTAAMFDESRRRAARESALVPGSAGRLVSSFLSIYLANIPGGSHSKAYVVDPRGLVIGSPVGGQRPGAPIAEPGFVEAFARRPGGTYTSNGTERSYASARVRHTRWRVVLTIPTATLHSGISSRLQWMILVALALASAIALMLLGRMVKTAAALAESQKRYALALAGANDGIWDWDLTLDRVYLSPRWKRMLGYADADVGFDPEEWLGRVHPEDRRAVDEAVRSHLLGRTDHFEVEHRVRAADGHYRWMLARGLAVRDADGRPTRIAGSQTDITERKRAESQLQHDALHDALTGLPNRVLFLDRLEHAMRRSARQTAGAHAAVLFLDLDRFKLVNDSLGHLAGDRLLIEVAGRLDRALRHGDTVARLGGDEFTVLLEDLTDLSEAERVAERMLESLTAPFQLDDRELYLSASIGIALAPPDTDPGDVIRDADAAMYRAKAEGKGRHAMFDARLHAAATTRLDIETRLRRRLADGALNGQGLHVAYQPIFRGESGVLTGFEALARWAEPDGTRLTPDQFIPVAEETGLIYELGRLVLREACRQLAEWRAAHPQAHLTMAVNISGRQLLDSRFENEVRRALADHGLDPHALRLEITESDAAADPEAVRAALARVYEHVGVRSQLDDFGTGSSSLTFLRGFPGDALKIDRSFVLAMHGDEGAFQIVHAIVALAHNLGMEVVAEGVETPAQHDVLRSLGCEGLQGFLLGAPASAAQAHALIAAGSVPAAA